MNYKNGGFAATANYQVLADSNRSSLWNAGISYSWDTVKLEALYQATHDKGGAEGYAKDWTWSKKDKNGNVTDHGYNSLDEQQALLGVEWKVGPGRLNASAQWLSVEGNGNGGAYSDIDADAWKVAVGYTYNLSKRTSLYGIAAYTDWDDDKKAAEIFGDYSDKVTGLQFGITHKF